MRQKSHFLMIIVVVTLLFTSDTAFVNYPAKLLHSQTASDWTTLKKTISVPPPPAYGPPFLPPVYGGWTGQSEWSSYLFSTEGNGFSKAETTLNPTTISKLTRYWSYHAKGAISSQPVVANGMIYWGSWDGLEHATDLSGHQVWATKVGQTTDDSCNPPSAGTADTATVATVLVNGIATSAVFVGGGDAAIYALDAGDGSVIWRTQLGSSPADFLWSSPTVYNGSVYIGMASFGDCPTVQGQVIQLKAATGNIQHVFSTVPDGCTGGGVWSSPVVDTHTGMLYISIGNADTCPLSAGYPSSLVELRASDLSFVDYWKIPQSECVIDCDFGATPTLFTATIDGAKRSMIGLAHKNGTYYAFIRDAISDGPVWAANIAGGGSDPEDGDGSISPSAWDGNRLYVAGGGTSINGNYCRGSVRALDPATGNFLWEHCLANGPVLAPVTVIPDIVVVEEGPTMDIISAASGKTLFTYTDSNNGSVFGGAASIANGVLYVGNFDGNLYAFGLPEGKQQAQKNMVVQ